IECLYDKSRRGFLRGIFSRATIILLIIILQLVVVAMSYLWLHQYRIHLQVTEVVLCILAIIYLFQSDMEPTAVNTWLLIVLPFPI
ncbi:cardiolipin synthase, partial [Streptococcus thermophilus]